MPINSDFFKKAKKELYEDLNKEQKKLDAEKKEEATSGNVAKPEAEKKPDNQRNTTAVSHSPPIEKSLPANTPEIAGVIEKAKKYKPLAIQLLGDYATEDNINYVLNLAEEKGILDEKVQGEIAQKLATVVHDFAEIRGFAHLLPKAIEIGKAGINIASNFLKLLDRLSNPISIDGQQKKLGNKEE